MAADHLTLSSTAVNAVTVTDNSRGSSADVRTNSGPSPNTAAMPPGRTAVHLAGTHRIAGPRAGLRDFLDMVRYLA